MTDNFPLLPDKSNALCADVRKVLRETFRQVNYLPPITDELLRRKRSEDGSESDNWIKELNIQYEELHSRERELQCEYASRLARETLPHIYTLHSPQPSDEDVSWKRELGALKRKDLKLSVEQNANCCKSLWVQNMLNRSSGDISKLQVKHSPKSMYLPLPATDGTSLQSISLGEIIEKVPPPPVVLPPSPPLPAYIVCVPGKVNFVNFTVGQLHTQSLRIVNVSKQEVTISIPPLLRQDIRLELCSRLTITSGSTCKIKLHFTPQSVREVIEEIVVRVSVGSAIRTPIRCYMEPPLLEMLLPQQTNSCSPEPASVINQDVLDLGAKLLGDVHRSLLVLHSSAKHASFFTLSEDSWHDFTIMVVTDSRYDSNFGVATDCFYITPARWSGSALGTVCCRVTSPGTHIAALRVISSTAIVRPLHLVADGLEFSSKHITIEAHEKDYDISSDSDPQCEYYVQLGTAYPQRSLSAVVHVVNHSSLSYNYYWQARNWKKDQYRRTSENALDIEGLENNTSNNVEGKLKISEEQLQSDINSREDRITVDIRSGILSARSTNAVLINVQDVGTDLGIQRAVLMLVLKDIPSESLSNQNHPFIVETHEVHEEAIPGFCSSWTREVGSVVCAQLEVWWNVVPVRLILEPPLVRLPCCRRVESANIPLRATLLYGANNIQTKLDVANELVLDMELRPGIPVKTNLFLPLNTTEDPSHIDVIRLIKGEEWKASSQIETFCSIRCLSIRPVLTWLGVVTPGACITAHLTLYNNTLRHINWQGTCYPWHQDKTEDFCESEVCDVCYNLICSCTALVPSGGILHHGESVPLRYSANAPGGEGCVVILIQVNTAGDAECSASAALVAFRVLVPMLVLRVLPCYGDKNKDCEGCTLDPGVHNKGTATLRPSSALCVNKRSCYRIRITNTTPLSTNVTWESVENEDVVKVTFIPHECKLSAYSEVDVVVVLEAMSVCLRRVFVRRAAVKHSKSLYLLIDTAVSGVEVAIEIPIGGDEYTDSFVTIKMTQKEETLGKFSKINLTYIEEMFATNDIKRAKLKRNICYCLHKMVYIPPKKIPQPPLGPEEAYPVEIVETPPLTCVCRCTAISKPQLPHDVEPYCLQFKQLPLNTVRSRTVVLRNMSRTQAHWSTAVRRWPWTSTRNINMGQRAREPGMSLQCSPASGAIRARSSVSVIVSVYADSWGLYFDQILFHVVHLEPIVLDVWVEAVGKPLQLALCPSHQDTEAPVLWMSSSDPQRLLRLSNTSRAVLNIYTCIVKDNDRPQDELPFRVYLRLYDALPPECPCVYEYDSSSSEINSTKSSDSCFEEIDTAMELFLAPDCGVQDNRFYQVEPLEIQLKAGANAEFCVRLLETRELVPNTTLLLRSISVRKSGGYWCRPAPPVQLVHLRHALRLPRLEASRDKILVTACVLDLPRNDVMRVRKHFNIRNSGSGALDIRTVSSAPWRVDVAQRICDSHCIPLERSNNNMTIHLPPYSSSEMYVEITIVTEQACPSASAYPPHRTDTGVLHFFDTDNIMLLEIPLILELDLPVISLQPKSIDFGNVSVECTRKSYFTVSHSSLRATVALVVKYDDDDLSIHPQQFPLTAGENRRVYVQYTSRCEDLPIIGLCEPSAKTCDDVNYVFRQNRQKMEPLADDDLTLPFTIDSIALR